MTDFELIQEVKNGDAVVADVMTAYSLRRICGRVCAAHGLLDDAADAAFGCTRLDGLFGGKPDKAAVALEWMEQNYDSIMYVLGAVVELLDDASAGLADLPTVKEIA